MTALAPCPGPLLPLHAQSPLAAPAIPPPFLPSIHIITTSRTSTSTTLPQDEFSFPRPENDEEIEMLCENIMCMRGLDDIPHLSID